MAVGVPAVGFVPAVWGMTAKRFILGSVDRCTCKGVYTCCGGAPACDVPVAELLK